MENEEDEVERESSADFAKIDIRVNAHKKFDIKQLKIEIWKIITLKGIPSLNYRANFQRMDDKKFKFNENFKSNEEFKTQRPNPRKFDLSSQPFSPSKFGNN